MKVRIAWKPNGANIINHETHYNVKEAHFDPEEKEFHLYDYNENRVAVIRGIYSLDYLTIEQDKEDE